MAYSNRLYLKEHIGCFGLFYNDQKDKTIKIGKLISVTENGNCEDQDMIYYDNFRPKTKEEIFKLLDRKIT